MTAFTLSQEHELLRKTVRKIAETEIAPHAARADESGELPQASVDALVRHGLHAVHLPTEVGGEGGDALASCLVVEEVARVCATTSLVPSVNKVATLPLLLAGSAEQRRRYLTRWRGTACCSPTRCRSRTRAATPRPCAPGPSATATTTTAGSRPTGWSAHQAPACARRYAPSATAGWP